MEQYGDETYEEYVRYEVCKRCGSYGKYAECGDKKI